MYVVFRVKFYLDKTVLSGNNLIFVSEVHLQMMVVDFKLVKIKPDRRTKL